MPYTPPENIETLSAGIVKLLSSLAMSIAFGPGPVGSPSHHYSNVSTIVVRAFPSPFSVTQLSHPLGYHKYSIQKMN